MLPHRPFRAMSVGISLLLQARESLLGFWNRPLGVVGRYRTGQLAAGPLDLMLPTTTPPPIPRPAASA